MTTKLLWVRQYAHTANNMGRAHIAQEGDTFTLCGLSLRDTAVWGHAVMEGKTVQNWCYRCRHNAFSGGHHQ